MKLPAVMHRWKWGTVTSSSRPLHRGRANSVEHHHFELPRLRELFRRAIPQIVEATLIPLGLFYAALSAFGPKGAICTALAWNYAALLRRIWRRERLPGVLLIATLGLTARSVLALVSKGSLFVYFLQPSLATALLGGAFLLSVPLGRPLAEKLAHDFVPMPASFVKRPKVRQLFVRISLLWALVSLANAAGTVAMLVNFPIATYLAAKTGFSSALTIGGIVLSSWWFRRSLRRHNAEQQLALAAE
ncbi:MAG TPA: VC0807 family protein [Acidimicrobiales bacterium]|nr:VC0807 family protein [Acidimicrobiales bacterium]